MTQEEKALAYDEALRKIRPLYERAKKEDCPIWSTYEYVFPELREGQENNVIDIPFGAKDSELKYWEYTIPEGMEAVIKDGKVIVKEKKCKAMKAIESIIRVYGKTQGEWIDGYDMDTLVVHLRKAFTALEKQKSNN